MKRFNSRLAPLCLLACAAMVGAQTAPRPGFYTPNFQNQDIATVADAVGAAIGKTFIPDPRVRANISMSIPTGAPQLSAQQFYNMFLAVLAQNGFSVVPAGGNTLKIVPEQNARSMPGNDLPTGGNLAPDDVVTEVLEVKNISVNSAAQTLRQFMSQGAGQIAPMPGTPYMIVTDRAANVARIRKLLARVDQSPSISDQVVPLQNALASEVVKSLTPLLQAQPADAASGTAPPKVQADDRTSIIIVSGDAAQRLRITALIEAFDAPVSAGSGVEVVELKYALATDLATTLTAYVNGTSATATGGAGAAGGAAAPSIAANADRSTKITAHEATNKLIITAAPRSLVILKDIIAALDIPPDQVLIEAIVAELTDTQAADLGVNWAVFSNDSNTSVPISGFISPVAGASIVNAAAAVIDVEATIAAGGLPQGATFGVGNIKDTGVSFAAMLRAINTDANNNIVSLPKVTATNNQEAEMKSGQQVPFVTGQYTNTGATNGGSSTVNPFTTVNREDVGTTLKVTPQIIADNDEVILKIDLVSSELTRDSGDAGSRITNTRSVKTNVRVRSGGMIVIGGMIKNNSQKSETRVPLLSRIPFFGELFRTRGGNQQKTNMMVFIQPKILRDAIQANAETAILYNGVRDGQQVQGARKELIPVLPRNSTPILPEMPPVPPAVTPTAPAPAIP
jgi:general secretion pathway protein D